MIDLATITGTASGLIELLKDAVGLAKKRGDVALTRALSEVEGKFLKLQSQLGELANENLRLNQRVLDLRKGREGASSRSRGVLVDAKRQEERSVL